MTGTQPYTPDDLAMGEQITRELGGLNGFEAWAERIAKAIAAERERGGKQVTGTDEATLRLARRAIGDAIGNQSAHAALEALEKAGIALTAAAQAGDEPQQLPIPESMHWLGDRDAAEETRHAIDMRGCVLFFERQSDCLEFMRRIEAGASAPNTLPAQIRALLLDCKHYLNCSVDDKGVREVVARIEAVLAGPETLGRAEDGWVLVQALQEMIRRTRTRLESYCNEANAGRMPSDAREFMRRVQCGFDSLSEEAHQMLAARPSPPTQSGEGENSTKSRSVKIEVIARALAKIDGEGCDTGCPPRWTHYIMVQDGKCKSIEQWVDLNWNSQKNIQIANHIMDALAETFSALIERKHVNSYIENAAARIASLTQALAEAREVTIEECATTAEWADHGEARPRAKDANATIAAAIRARAFQERSKTMGEKG